MILKTDFLNEGKFNNLSANGGAVAKRIARNFIIRRVIVGDEVSGNAVQMSLDLALEKLLLLVSNASSYMTGVIISTLQLFGPAYLAYWLSDVWPAAKLVDLFLLEGVKNPYR